MVDSVPMRPSHILLTTAALVSALAAVQCEAPAGDGAPVELWERDSGPVQGALDAQAGPRTDRDADAAAGPDEETTPDLPARDGGRFPSDGAPFPIRDGAVTCPASSPGHGTECNAMATCAYDGLICTCPHHGQGDSGRGWSCFTAPVQVDGGACPGTQPHSNAVCSIEGLNCRYGRAQCFCGGSSNADDAVWDCR
jgi:hypothetical protein